MISSQDGTMKLLLTRVWRRLQGKCPDCGTRHEVFGSAIECVTLRLGVTPVKYRVWYRGIRRSDDKPIASINEGSEFTVEQLRRVFPASLYYIEEIQ